MSANVPPWIYPDAWRPLTPPAIVMQLGAERSAANLAAASNSLFVTTAPRYQPRPNGATLCNIYLADVLTILRAPIPHLYDLGDGRGPVELRANDIVDGLRAGIFADWSPLTMNDATPAIVAGRASVGLPTIGVWKNLALAHDAQGRVLMLNGKPVLRSGHVVLVVPTPAGHSGVYVTGAGKACIAQCAIADAFGDLVPQVEFYGHP